MSDQETNLESNNINDVDSGYGTGESDDGGDHTYTDDSKESKETFINCPRMEFESPYPNEMSKLFGQQPQSYGSRKFASPVDTLTMEDMMKFVCNEDEKRCFGSSDPNITVDNLLDALVKERDETYNQWKKELDDDKLARGEERRNKFQKDVRCQATTVDASRVEHERIEHRLESVEHKLDNILQSITALSIALVNLSSSIQRT